MIMKRLLFLIAMSVTGISFAQVQVVTGKITDSKDGTPLAGATVQAKGHTDVTISDAAGNFRLSIPATTKTLVISHVSYKSTEVSVTDGAMDIKLDKSDQVLSEVMVVGYGTKIKREVTSSVSKVSSRDFQNLPLPSFESALQGRASGVLINNGSGKLGQGLTVQVRGISSISASAQPFVVIDGVPVVSGSLASAGGAALVEPDNPLASLNPDDIESIEVLKDAAASAIYGARASNGVLLITTKSGKVGKTKMTVGYFTGFSRPTHKRKFLNAQQYRQLFGDAANNSSFNGIFWNANDPADAWLQIVGTNDWADNINTDVNWADLAFQDGEVNQYSLSLAGGDARTRFFVSGSYNDQKGIIWGNRFTRGNGRVNLDHTVSSRLKMGLNLSLSATKNYRVPSDNDFANPVQLNAIPPINKIYDDNGKYNTTTLYYNNLIDRDAVSQLSTGFRSLSNIYAELAIAPNLSLRSNVGYDWNNYLEDYFFGKETLTGAPTGLGHDGHTTSSVVTNSNILTYKNDFNDIHSLEALVGVEYQYGRTISGTAQGQGFPSDRFKKLASSSQITTGISSETEFVFQTPFLSRVNYKFKDKILAGGSIRYDGSSRFGKDNRFGWFPAASVGYILSEENFIKNLNVVSYLKIRGSYGTTGNAEIGNFSSLTLYSATPYAELAGIFASQIGVPDLSWERTNQLDIGLDFGLFKNRISAEIDYFSKDTRDLLLSAPLPATNGFTSVVRNIGSMTNKGFDVSVNSNNLIGKFRWSTSLNVSTYKNKVTRLVAEVPPGSRLLGRLAEGQPFGQFFGIKYAGVDPANGDALYYKEDGKTTTNDPSEAGQLILGDPNPEFYGGINNRFSYKGFDLDVQCQFVYGNDVFNMAGFFQSTNGSNGYDNQTVDQMNYWKKAGDITNVPQPRLFDGNGSETSSRWIEDGSYFRVKSVNFGYNIPGSVLKRLKLDNARIYISANNLFTFTKYSGYDPELNTSAANAISLGHDFYTPPQARTIAFGINIGL